MAAAASLAVRVTLIALTVLIEGRRAADTRYVDVSSDVVMIGAVLPIHTSLNGACGSINSLGIIYSEAIAYVVETINNRSDFVPGVKFGFEIHDSCSVVNFALDETLDLLTLRTPQKGFGISTMIGEFSSAVTIPIAQLLGLFRLPFVSFSATDSALSDKTQFKYFLRTAPSDTYEAMALTDIVSYFNWTYVAAIQSGDVYGRDGMSAFLEKYKNETLGRCIADNNVIEIPYPGATTQDYDKAVDKLMQPYVINATVVVAFAQVETLYGLLDAIERRRETDPTFTKEFIWNMQRRVCNGSAGLCSAALAKGRFNAVTLDGDLLIQHLLNVTFERDTEGMVSFDRNGDVPAEYKVENLQRSVVTPVGEWVYGQLPALTLSTPVVWNQINESIRSFCSAPCNSGEYPIPVAAAVGRAVPAQELTPTLGLVLSTILGCIMLINVNHKVVKASSRELMALLFVGLFLCYSMPFVFIAAPSPAFCAIRRFGIGFSYSACFIPILVRVIRIHRIFNRQVSTITPMFTSPFSQVIVALVLLFVQVIISTLWLALERPNVEFIYSPQSGEIKCSENPYIGLSITLGYNAVILILTVYFAFRTRKVPAGFNETKFVSITASTLVVIWTAFILTYFGTASLGSVFQTGSQVYIMVSNKWKDYHMSSADAASQAKGSWTEIEELDDVESEEKYGEESSRLPDQARIEQENGRRELTTGISEEATTENRNETMQTSGDIPFISKAWTGHVSDKVITQRCGFLDHIEFGDVLADHGFNFHDDLAVRGAKIDIPAFTKGKSQLS
eukprot:Em0022g763a